MERSRVATRTASEALCKRILENEQRIARSETRTPPWRLFVPSFSDLIFLSLLAWLFLSHPDGWSRLLMDGDTGWHIRTGQAILETGHVPRVDPFSFSKAGEPWFAWEWGADVVLAMLHQGWGLKGVVLLGGALIALYGAVMFRFITWRGSSALLALLATLLAVSAASIHFLARPHLITLVLIPVTLWILEADRRRQSWLVWLLVPMTAVWTNLHGGFLALIALAALLAVGSALEAAWENGWTAAWPSLRRYGSLTALCLLASVANPYGVRLHLHIFEYLRADWIRNVISEFQSPKFRSEALLHYQLLMFAGLLIAGWLLSRKRVVEPLWILFWAHQSLSSARHATVLVTVAAPVIATELSRLWSEWVRRGSPGSVRRSFDAISSTLGNGSRWTSIWPITALVVLLLVPVSVHWP
jgi:hypothetical protein